MACWVRWYQRKSLMTVLRIVARCLVAHSHPAEETNATTVGLPRLLDWVAALATIKVVVQATWDLPLVDHAIFHATVVALLRRCFCPWRPFDGDDAHRQLHPAWPASATPQAPRRLGRQHQGHRLPALGLREIASAHTVRSVRRFLENGTRGRPSARAGRQGLWPPCLCHAPRGLACPECPSSIRSRRCCDSHCMLSNP